MAQLTDAEKIEYIKLVLGDIPGGPYYPMFDDAQYAMFLKASRGSVNKALVMAAISSGYMVAGESSREVIGELSIASSSGSNYLKLLQFIIDEAGKTPPPSMMPWFAGMDRPDCNKLLNYNRCDDDWRWTFESGRPKPCGGC